MRIIPADAGEVYPVSSVFCLKRTMNAIHDLSR